MPDIDFETYSEAGNVWNPATEKWDALPGASQGRKGLPIVGAAVYAEHPSTEVLSLYYDLKDGKGRRFWCPGMANPDDLFATLSIHTEYPPLGPIEAWNVAFERWIWNKVCVPKYGWPPLPIEATRCAMAKARASCYPGALAKSAEVMRLTHQKDPDGDRLIKKFSMPRNPTKSDRRLRIRPEDDPMDAVNLYAYNERDIVTEAEASARCPDLEGEELEFWLCDQRINTRGVQVDTVSVEACISVIDQAQVRYNTELYHLTGGEVARASELSKLQNWLHQRGIHMSSMDEDAIEGMLSRGEKTPLAVGGVIVGLTPTPALPAECRRALEIRQAIGSAAVKKVFAMRNQTTRAGRLHDLFSYHAARTGRATGNGPQPTNLPNSGPAVLRCSCSRHFGRHHTACPWCGMPQPPGKSPIPEWTADAAADAITVINTRDLATVEYYFGDAMPAISGSLRGLFIAAPSHDLICSDYSAIEAVGLAMLAGEQWRIDVFRTHGKIYEMSASKITGIPFEEFERHKRETGGHHPMRKKVGKVAELASGYQGWIGAWKAFGADEFFTDEEMKQAILKWRAASPAIVELWGGVDGCFIQAVQYPGHVFTCRGMTFEMRGDAVYLRLISGRYLTYHAPRLRPNPERGGLSISYEGWNTNPKNGPPGWNRMDTWGGRLVENITQATCRDILRHAIVNLERAGYPVVLHVYDEIVCEIPEGWGSIEEFERIMATMPAWAVDWPVRAAGGWRKKRYSK
jgi:DNA polymerase